MVFALLALFFMIRDHNNRVKIIESDGGLAE